MTLTYCANLVRQHDPDRFLLSLLAPARVREALWAVYAFNHEITKTRDVVSETVTGLIRLQWWREAVGEIYDGRPARQNEILPALARAVHDFGLARTDFDTVIYAHEFDLEAKAPATLEGLRHYADFIATPIMNMTLRIAGETDTDSVIKQVAADHAMIHLVRSVPKHTAQGRMFLPDDVMGRYGVSLQKMRDFNQKEHLPDVIKVVLGGVSQNRNTRSRLLRAMQKMSMMHMGQVKRAGYDPFSPSLAVPPPCMALRLVRFI